MRTRSRRARVEVVEKTDRVEVLVHESPAIRHLRAGGREIVTQYGQHCFSLGNAGPRPRGLRCG